MLLIQFSSTKLTIVLLSTVICMESILKKSKEYFGIYISPNKLEASLFPWTLHAGRLHEELLN